MTTIIVLIFLGLVALGVRDEYREKKAKENAMDIDTIQFTIDLPALIRTALNDPKCREEIYQAVREGAGEPTTVLGAANLATEGGSPEWFTLFLGTDRRVEPGAEGYVLRNRKGTRISARLKRQVKNQQAQTPGTVLPREAEGGSHLVAQALAGDPQAAAAILKMIETTEEAQPEVVDNDPRL